MYLTEETDPDEAVASLTPRRSSQARRKELERIATLCTPRETDIHVRFTSSGASCRPKNAPNSYEIRIPTRRYEQILSDVDPVVWDRLMQVALLFHELGHVLYSGFSRFKTHLDDIHPRWQSLFKEVYNAAEDAAVEAQMAAAFRIHDDFVLKSASLSRIADRRHREFVAEFSEASVPDSVRTVLPVEANLTMNVDNGPEGGTPVQEYTVYEALSLSLLDRGTVDSGRCRELLDPSCYFRQLKGEYRDTVIEIDTMADEYMTKMRNEPDPGRRVEHARTFFTAIRPIFQDLPPLQRSRIQMARIQPSDVVAASDWSPREAAQLDTDNNGTGTSTTGGGVSSVTIDPTNPESGITNLDIDGVRRRHAGGGFSPDSQVREDVTTLLTMVTDDDIDVDQIRVLEPTDEGGPTDRWAEIRKAARRLEHQLHSRLRKERRPRKRPRSRRGTVDSRELVSAVHGSDRVFSRLTPGKDKDYSCQLFLDRSGTMRNHIVPAEDAVCQLAVALHSVGVDVSVCSLYESVVTLELPFGARPAAWTDRLVSGRTAGSTPLSDAITVASHRAGHGSGTVPFVVVVTDGRADDIDAYERAVDRCHCPVFGVYLDDKYDHDTYFDRVVYTQAGDVGPTLMDLVRNLFRGYT